MANKWRRTRAYRIWRVQVLRRDKHCVVCKTIKNRHAHHMNHSMYFKEERFDVDNGVTLCRHCHMVFHTSFKRSYRTKCTKYDFSQYLELIDRMQHVLKNKTLDK